MARRKKTKRKTRRTSFKLGISKRKKRRKIINLPSLIGILKVLAVICAFAVVAIGLVFLNRYVKKTVPVSQSSAPLKLVNVPGWVSEQLKEKVYAAATAGGEDLKLDEEAARLVQQNIETRIAWLDGVEVLTGHDGISIEGRWRRPMALVKRGLQSFYVDAEMVVLDFVPVPALSIVKVEGLSVEPAAPSPGRVWQKDDLAAAMTILARLDWMDKSVTPDKPLLDEIDRIDVSNFNGRQNSKAAHIILYTKDNTEIIWGAEFGTWQRYLEAKDEEKLANLYGYYKEHGSLSGDAKYINLQYSQDRVSLPVDKY